MALYNSGGATPRHSSNIAKWLPAGVARCTKICANSVLGQLSNTGFASLLRTVREEICVRKVGLCGSDLNTFVGKNPMVTYPRILGHEVAGTIAELGSAVESDFRVGTDVTFTPYTACEDALRAARGGATLAVTTRPRASNATARSPSSWPCHTRSYLRRGV
jgi:hypothetical protein